MTLSEEKIANPVDFYDKPEEVDQDNTLSKEEKIKVLTNWRNDIELREVAEAENMRSIHNSSDHYIQKIESLLRKYGA
jgi:hypothetical protein